MKVTEKQPYMLLPVKGYRGDLKITDSSGEELIILSDNEFEEQFGVAMEKIMETYLQNLKKDLSDEYLALTKEYRVVAVMFNREIDEYYEKIRVTWYERFENRKPDGPISRCVELPIYLPRYGFAKGARSAIYLSVKTNSKYQILGEPIFNDLRLRKAPEHKKILDDERHVIYRFSESQDPQLIQFVVRIGLPDSVKTWAQIGLFSAIVVPAFIIYWTVVTISIPQFAFETIAGIIAFIAGLRVVVFHDSSLMKRWGRLHLGAMIWCGILIVALMVVWTFFSFLPNGAN